jgi:U3 small nucleolar RNA-associated protein 21
MSFSTVHDSRNKSLGRASFNKLETKKTDLKLDQHKMPPILEFDSNEVKESEWDGIVCVHDNLRLATTWNFNKTTMGKFKLEHSRFKENEKLYANVNATVSLIISFVEDLFEYLNLIFA